MSADTLKKCLCGVQLIRSFPVITGVLYANKWKCHIPGAWKHLDACILSQSVVFMGNKTLTDGCLKQSLWQGFAGKKKSGGRLHTAVLAVFSLVLHAIPNASQNCACLTLPTFQWGLSHANVHFSQLCFWPKHQTESAIRHKMGEASSNHIFHLPFAYNFEVLWYSLPPP